MELFAFLGTLSLQLGLEVVRQLALAMPIAFLWEFEREIVWWHRSDHHVEAEVGMLVSGLAAGAISALILPQGYTNQRPFFEIAAVLSPVVTGLVMYRAGALLRERGIEPPALFTVRAATIIAIGMSLIRVILR